MVPLCRPVVLTLATIVMAPSPAKIEPPRRPQAQAAGASVETVAAARDADLFVEPELVVLPTFVSGDVARVRLEMHSRRDAPLEIEEIGIRDLRFTVRVPGGWSGEGRDRVACDPPLRIEPRGSLALEFEAQTRGREGLFRKSIAAKVRGNSDAIQVAEVSARVVRGYSVTPGLVDFGEVRRGQSPTTLDAVVETEELGPIRILSVKPKPRGSSPLPFSITAPTEAESKPGRRHVVTVQLDAAASVGDYRGSFELEADSPQRVNPGVSVHARIVPNLEVRLRDQVVPYKGSWTLQLGLLRRSGDPIELVVRDTRPDSDWHPGDATLTFAHEEGEASLAPKFEVVTAPGATAAERRIRVRLLELGSQPAVHGELRLPLHHPDLDELVLPWSAFLRER